MTASPLSLIQLVSEQTLPNVFPALAANPAQVVLLHTPQTRRQCDWIGRALSLAGQASAPLRIELPDNPDHHATGQVVLDRIDSASAAGLRPVVNITGGTKLMSIGAFAAAHQRKAPGFYLDTTHRTLLPATTTPLPSPLDSSPRAFGRIAEQLTVSILTAAHGTGQLSPGRDPEPWLPAARLLLADPALEQTTHDFALHHFDEGHRKPADYARLVASELDDLPDALIEPLALAGAIALRGDRWRLYHPDPECFARWASGERYDSIETYFAATAPLQQTISFLQGGWWELAVLEAARASGRFRDLQWSVNATRPGGALPIEEDLLGVEDLSLAVFSCKRTGERSRLLRAFEELDSAARQLGGTFARRYLAVATPIASHSYSEISSRLVSGNAKLIGPASRLKKAFQ